MTQHPLAVQLYTLREAVKQDYVGTLRAVAELGYGAVELVTLGSFSAADLRRELDLLGLEVCAVHVQPAQLEQHISTVLDDLETLGTRYAVWPWLPPERRTAASYREVARSLGQIGRECQARGVQLCYHHHDFELVPAEGTSGFEILLSEVDPALLHFEIDVYWAAFAGRDPLALLRGLAGRVPLVHLKDMSADSRRTFSEVGQGQLDFPAILKVSDEIGVEWLVVEQDQCERPPLQSVGISLNYLRSLGRG